jgi:hypothetical protein
MIRDTRHFALLSWDGAGLTEGSDLPEAAIFRKVSGVSCLTGSIVFASSTMETQPFRSASKSPIQRKPPETLATVLHPMQELESWRKQPFRF